MAELDGVHGGTQAHESPAANQAPDFRIRRLGGHDWEIRILSPLGKTLALESARIELADTVGTTFRTDLHGINGFMREARERGYRAEYVGPNEVVQF